MPTNAAPTAPAESDAHSRAVKGLSELTVAEGDEGDGEDADPEQLLLLERQIEEEHLRRKAELEQQYNARKEALQNKAKAKASARRRDSKSSLPTVSTDGSLTPGSSSTSSPTRERPQPNAWPVGGDGGASSAAEQSVSKSSTDAVTQASVPHSRSNPTDLDRAHIEAPPVRRRGGVPTSGSVPNLPSAAATTSGALPHIATSSDVTLPTLGSPTHGLSAQALSSCWKNPAAESPSNARQSLNGKEQNTLAAAGQGSCLDAAGGAGANASTSTPNLNDLVGGIEARTGAQVSASTGNLDTVATLTLPKKRPETELTVAKMRELELKNLGELGAARGKEPVSAHAASLASHAVKPKALQEVRSRPKHASARHATADDGEFQQWQQATTTAANERVKR